MNKTHARQKALQHLNSKVIIGFVAIFSVVLALAEPTSSTRHTETNVEEIVRELRAKELISQSEADKLVREHHVAPKLNARIENSGASVTSERLDEGFFDAFDYELLIILSIVFVAFGLPAIAILCVTYWSFRRRKLMHETINALIAKDRDIPQSMLAYIDTAYSGTSRYFEAGVFLIAIGLALLTSLWIFVGAGISAFIGLPPTALGIGNLILWRAKKKREEYYDHDTRA